MQTGLSNRNSIKDKPEKQHDKDWSIIIKNLLSGLKHVHDKHEMIHRDIKPSNILFLHKGDLSSLKIWDFGLSKNVGVGFFDQNDDNAGTLIYQAPEQIKGIAYG